MVVQQPLTAFTAWDRTETRPPLSPRSLMIGGAILAVHLAGAAYLYQMRIAPHFAPVEEAPPIQAVTVRLPEPDHAKPPPPPPPNVVHVHQATRPVPPTVQHIEAMPQPKPADPVFDGPPELPKVIEPTGPTAIATPPAPSKVIANPAWITRPSAEQLSQFYPPRALEDGLSGEATLDCVVTATGQLTHCVTSGETPRNHGFAQAALKAAGIFRMSPRTVDGQPVEGGTVHIPIHFAVKD